ncbi:hypothetical protein [uncultured Bradyrhizobium sp.]|uniref:hypothetical protein n=1 Tax=uncultured Bradyrhizobium sp. TaxID=199684 RepID=UPI00345BA7A0
MFGQTAEPLEIRGDNPFRSRACRNAARLIERLPKSITSLLKAGEDLSELPGIARILRERSRPSSRPANSACLTGSSANCQASRRDRRTSGGSAPSGGRWRSPEVSSQARYRRRSRHRAATQRSAGDRYLVLLGMM